MDLTGAIYSATMVSNLLNVPVRIVDDTKTVFSHAPVELAADPVRLVLDHVLAVGGSVGYVMAEDYFYYGIVRTGDLRLVFGPLREALADELSCRHMGILLSVSPEKIDGFIAAVRSLDPLPLYSALRILCILNYTLNGEMLDLTDIVLHDEAQQSLTRQLAEESFKSNEFRGDGERTHSSEQVEGTITDLIRSGQPDELREYLRNIPSFRVGTLSPDRLRHEKNTFVASVTVMSRAAIAGGVDADDAFTLSDSYINRCELLSNPNQIYELYYHMVIEYAEMVRRVRVGENPSDLVIGVANYVRRHIFEPIRTEDVAKALFVSRGFLSTRFKQETGVSLADFIQQEKIEEAKRLLVRTDQPLLAISTYLGFSSQSHFNTVFKKREGMTPREFRQGQR